MPKPLLHDGEHILVATAFGLDQPFGGEPRQSEGGREQVAAPEGPKHRSLQPGGNSRREQGRGGAVAQFRRDARDFVQRVDGQAGALESFVNGADSERQVAMRPLAVRGFDRPHLGPQGFQGRTRQG